MFLIKITIFLLLSGTNKNLKAVFYRISSDASNTKNCKTCDGNPRIFLNKICPSSFEVEYKNYIL
jgi:hypothetical protein